MLTSDTKTVLEYIKGIAENPHRRSRVEVRIGNSLIGFAREKEQIAHEKEQISREK